MDHWSFSHALAPAVSLEIDDKSIGLLMRQGEQKIRTVYSGNVCGLFLGNLPTRIPMHRGGSTQGADKFVRRASQGGKDIIRQLKTDRGHAVLQEKSGLEEVGEYSMETSMPGRSGQPGV
jgi:hypothetical protein